MNNSEQKLLNRLLLEVRKVYSQDNFINAHDMATRCYRWLLSNKDMINNERFNKIAKREIDKAFSYANSLSYRNKNVI